MKINFRLFFVHKFFVFPIFMISEKLIKKWNRNTRTEACNYRSKNFIFTEIYTVTRVLNFVLRTIFRLKREFKGFAEWTSDNKDNVRPYVVRSVFSIYMLRVKPNARTDLNDSTLFFFFFFMISDIWLRKVLHRRRQRKIWN